ncbi:MAG: efflux RND transporter periplasmic adaptor subunit, partial [Bdellovibrionales bacterium]|nr:efflux RND transporter periplasmic adaptor subunit [Bdellovibrionales bacterium]
DQWSITMTTESSPSSKQRLRESLDSIFGTLREKLGRAFYPGMIILAGFAVAVLLIVLRESPPKVAPEKIPTLVTVIDTKLTSVRALVQGFGTIEAERRVDVRPQVQGFITEMNDTLQVGGRFTKGDLLFQIDPRDYELAVDTQKANVARAEYELQLEEGNQIVAQKEWDLLSEDLKKSTLHKDLALRKPQLREKQAALAAAKSQLQKAKLDLERTQARAPFDALVLSENVDVGQYVNSQTTAVTLAASEAFYVRANIPRTGLQWLRFNGEGLPQEDYHVVLRQKVDRMHVAERPGKIVRLLGDVDETGRMARVLISLSNPLESLPTAPAYLLGSFVEVAIEGTQVQDVVELPRGAVREGDVVWMVSDQRTLALQKVEPILTRGDVIYVQGLSPSSQIVTNSLQYALEGMPLEISQPKDPQPTDGAAQ